MTIGTAIIKRIKTIGMSVAVRDFTQRNEAAGIYGLLANGSELTVARFR